MVENIRKAEFDAAQPVRNKETGKIDYIVRVADHKRHMILVSFSSFQEYLVFLTDSALF
jgi:hypothetical protein